MLEPNKTLPSGKMRGKREFKWFFLLPDIFKVFLRKIFRLFNYSAPRLSGPRISGLSALVAMFSKSQIDILGQMSPVKRPSRFSGQKMLAKTLAA